MTNKEKAKEIANEALGDFATSFLGMIDEYSEMFCTEAALRAAEWKDDTIRDTIKKEIDRANKYYDQKLSSTQMTASIRVVQVLSELIGEKFPYDDLHMGFATMD